MSANITAVTGAWSFSGRHVAQRLLASGWTLRSLSNRNPSPEDDPYDGRVRRIGYTHDVDRLARELTGCRVLVANFWTRHDKPPIGHRGPWLSHLQAVEQSAVLIEAAARAGVERLVWTSITNPGHDPDLSYFAGKAVVEQLARGSGLSYAILRPACFFGDGGILIDNVAWAARRLPFVPIPSGAPYRIRPIHVEDYADLVVEAVASSDNYTIDAVGPDRPEFGELVREVAEAAGGRANALRLPMKACRLSLRRGQPAPGRDRPERRRADRAVAQPPRLRGGIDRRQEPPGLGTDEQEGAGPALPSGTQTTMALALADPAGSTP